MNGHRFQLPHKFEIQLTEDQCAAISREWEAHGEVGRAMLALQPFPLDGKIKVVILTPDVAEGISDVIADRGR